MTTEKYLGQAKRFEYMIRNKMSEIERCREMSMSMTVATKQDVVQTSGNQDKMGTLLARVIDLKNEINVISLSRDKIIKQIEGIADPDMYQMLYSKYIEDLSFTQISRIIHRSRTNTYRLHDKSLEVFEEKYGKYYLDVF